MKSIYKTVLVALCILVFSCSKNDDANIIVETPIPIVSAIGPESGTKNTVVTINGNNFGTDASKVQVFFNGKEANVSQVRNTKIGTIVPAGAYTGEVKVIIDGTVLIGPEFEYILSGAVVTTLAGSREGFVDGNGIDARFNRPTGLAVDSNGNIFVADPGNHRIRKITPDGMVTTFSGGEKGDRDGFGSAAQFNAPWDVDIDADGNVYVADSGNHRIRKIAPNGNVITLAGLTQGNADGRGTDAQFDTPTGIAVTPAGIVYVADSRSGMIRKIDLEGNVTSFSSGFGVVVGITIDEEENVFFTEPNGHYIWKINFENNEIALIAGDGEGDVDGHIEGAQFRYPRGLDIDAEGNIYVVDEQNQKIKKISGDQVITYAGSIEGEADGSGLDAQFNHPFGVTVDTSGNVYVADTSNHRIRKIIQE
ncbi:IPT/TIG domain-containing protein [Flagellimonas hymeniacidonis]|nr:IPT/TIG domain-containing protein [Flagellimonas hymeniacidonis]